MGDLKTAIKQNYNTKMSMAPRLLKLKYGIKTKIGNLEERCSVKMQYLEEHNQRIRKYAREAEEKHQRNERVKDLLDAATTDVKVLKAAKEVEACDADFKTWILKLRKITSTDESISQETAKSIQNVVEKMSVIYEILNSIEEEVGKPALSTIKRLQEEIQGQITPGILKIMNTSTRCLVSLEGIYAVRQVQGKRRCAMISMNENKLCLHTLEEKQLPSYASTIEHEDAMKLVNPSSRLTFLEFCDEESTLGRIYVRLSPDTKRAQNFAVLCTGEMGPTYLGTSILGVGKSKDRESVYCGGYELDSSSIARAMIPGAEKDEERPVSAGSVHGCWWIFKDGQGVVNTDKFASFFSIVIRCCKDAAYPAVFGMVESGLDIVTEIVSHYPDIKKVKLKDSGIVLNE